MPEWLLKKEEYIPQNKKDTFIRKSILSVLGLLTRISFEGEHNNRSRISAVTKVIGTMLLILLISLSKNILFVLVAGIYLLVIVSMLKAEEIRYIIKTALIVGAFTYIIVLPSMFFGNKNNGFMMVMKVMESTAAVNILSSTTKWTDITGALKIFFIPDIFIFVLDITIKYIIIFGEFSLNMLYALKLRSIGTSHNKSTSLSGIVGTLFLKSEEMAEEMYGAMECRGFTGKYEAKRRFRISVSDVIYILVNIFILLAYFYFDRL